VLLRCCNLQWVWRMPGVTLRAGYAGNGNRNRGGQQYPLPSPHPYDNPLNSGWLYTNDVGALNLTEFHVQSDEWGAQYFEPTLPAGTTSWSITKVRFRVREDHDNTTLQLQIRPVDASFKPTTTVLETVEVTWEDLLPYTSHDWYEIDKLGQSRMDATIKPDFRTPHRHHLLMLLAVFLALPLVLAVGHRRAVPAASTLPAASHNSADRTAITGRVDESIATVFSFDKMSAEERRVVEELHRLGADIAEIDNVPLRIHGLRVRLNGKQITGDGRVAGKILAKLKLLSNLRSLGLAASGFSDVGVRELADLNSLEELDLAETVIGDRGLLSLNQNGRLKSLKLHGCRVTAAGLAHLRGLKQLLALDLSSTRVASLEHLHTPNRLTALNLSATQVTDGDLKPLSRMPELRVLSLRHTRITNAAGETIGDLKRLESLDIGRTQITSLKFLSNLKELRELQLIGTRVSESELNLLTKLTQLNRLLLQGMQLTDTGLQHLSQLSNLQTLFISGRGITDTGLEHLHRLSLLRRLVLTGTNATVRGVAALKQVLPETQITGPSGELASETDSGHPDQEPDVIYATTPPEFVEKMLKLADIRPGDVVYDLGCGDGRYVIAAAEMYGVKAFGFDIDPERVRESRENVRRHNVEHLVTIEQADIFTLDLSAADVVTLYLLPELNVRLMPQLRQLKPGSRILSHEFDMRGARPFRTVNYTPAVAGWREHTIHLWTTPWDGK
jgi:hypothetical protein